MRNKLKQIFKTINYVPFSECNIEANLATQFTDHALNQIVDALIAKGVTAIPCEVNDTIYVIFSQFKSEISKCRVDEITITDRGIYVVVDIYYPRYVAERATSFPISWFDQFVFFSKEEAEQKLKEFMYG